LPQNSLAFAPDQSDRCPDAVITTTGANTMNTPNIESEAAGQAVAQAEEPKATKKATGSARKPRVAPAKGKPEKTTQAKKGEAKGREATQGWRRRPGGQQSRQGPGTAEAAEGRHDQRADESDWLATAFHSRVLVRNDWPEDGPVAHVHQG
jgi:hypothetical protein